MKNQIGSPTCMYLIVGIDGLVGKSLYRSYQSSQISLVGTSRRGGSTNSLYLDLSEDLTNWEPPQKVQTVFLLAGITNVKECEDRYSNSYRVNVESIIKIAKHLIKTNREIHIVYISSCAVFDGAAPFQKQDQPYSPLHQYGKQKQTTEELLGELTENLCIVRLTRLLESILPMLNKWIQSFNAGEKVTAFCDMTVAILKLDFVISILQLVALRKTKGILQVSGTEDVTFVQIAMAIADVLNFDKSLVVPISHKTVLTPQRALYESLDVSRIVSEFGLFPQDSMNVLKTSVK